MATHEEIPTLVSCLTDPACLLLEQASFLEVRRARGLPPQFPALSEFGLDQPCNRIKEER